MAISDNNDGSLSINDILRQIGGSSGDRVDFISLAGVLGINTSTGNRITLPSSFTGKNLNLSANSLTTSPTSLSFLNTGETKSVSLTSNGVFQIINIPNWIIPSVTFGQGNVNLVLSAFDNSRPGSEIRSGTISFRGSNNSIIRTLNVQQTGNEITATISPSTNQTLTNSSGTTSITVRLSTSVFVQSATISNTSGFTLSSPTTSTSAGITTYVYTLTRTTSTIQRSTIFTLIYTDNESFTGTLGPITFTQQAFVPTLSIATTSLSFVLGGETKTFALTSNTTWSSNVNGTGFQQSLTNSNFTTNNITGTGNSTIYVRALSHTGASRNGSVTVTTTSAQNNVSDSVTLTQAAAPIFTSDDITIVGFDVNFAGTITAPTLSPTGGTIVYSTLTNGGGTSYTFANGFPLVNVNTNRFATYTVIVPAGYQNTGASISKSVSAVQEFAATIDVTPQTHTFTNTGSGRLYSVSSNTTWVVKNFPFWITIDDTTGGGLDTQFTATAASQSNPAVRRSGTLRVETNTVINGIVSDDVSFEQPPLATWILNNIPNIGNGSQYSVENLKSAQNTAATGTEFFFNIPYTFDYMNNVAGSSFDRSNFGFWVNFGAGRSTTANRLIAGNKTFTMTPNTNVNGNLDQISYDVGQRVSIAETTLLRAITRYMIGTVTAWNQSTRVLSVNIASTSGHIVTNNTTTNYTSWEINQISGDAASFPRIYTRNANQSGNNRTTTIKIDDTNNTYEQNTLTKVITQPLEPLTGIVNIPASVDTAIANIGGSGTYTNNSASTVTPYVSVGIKTNYSYPFTVTKSGSAGVSISTTFDGPATSSILVNSSTTNITAFFIRYTTGGIAEITITDADGTVTFLTANITPQSTTSPPGTKPPLNQL